MFSFPKVVQLHTTSACNLRCDYCYSHQTRSLEISWIEVIEQAHSLGVSSIEFLGGEPFLDQNLREYLRYCDSRSIGTKIYTNGLLLDDNWFDFLSSLMHKPIIVFKFDRKDYLERVIGTGMFAVILRNIKRCCEYGIKVNGHVIVNALNYQVLPEILLEGEKNNLVVTFERYMPGENAKIDSKYILTAEQWNQSLRVINKYYQGLSPYYNINSVIKGNTCSCYVDILCVDVRGKVKPCPFALDEQIVGDVTTMSLKKIWKNFLEQRTEWMKIPLECRKCKNRLLCHGGCKTYTFLKKRTYDAKDPLCRGGQIPTSIFSDQFLRPRHK